MQTSRDRLGGRVVKQEPGRLLWPVPVGGVEIRGDGPDKRLVPRGKRYRYVDPMDGRYRALHRVFDDWVRRGGQVENGSLAFASDFGLLVTPATDAADGELVSTWQAASDALGMALLKLEASGKTPRPSRSKRSPWSRGAMVDMAQWQLRELYGLAPEEARPSLIADVNAALAAGVRPAVTPARRPLIELVPVNLLSALWLHVAYELMGGVQRFGVCRQCGRVFAMSRRDQTFCSESCRKLAWYHAHAHDKAQGKEADK